MLYFSPPSFLYILIITDRSELFFSKLCGFNKNKVTWVYMIPHDTINHWKYSDENILDLCELSCWWLKMHLSRAIFIKFILKRNENEAISAVVFKGRAVKAGCATKLYNASLMFIFSKGQEKEVGEQLHYREYANLITSKKENTCPSLFFGSYRPPFEHHSLPSCPAYLCMPGREKKRILCPFLCQLLMIAAAAP